MAIPPGGPTGDSAGNLPAIAQADSVGTPSAGYGGATSGKDTHTKIITTRPDHLLNHEITDAQLGELVNTNRDGLADWMWGAAGVAVGLAGPCAESLLNAFFENPTIPLSFAHVVELVAFGGFSGVAFAIYKIAGRRQNRAEVIAAEIRARPRG